MPRLYTWIIRVLWATNRALEQRAVSVSSWGHWYNAAACLTDHSYTQNKMLFIIYTSGIDSCLLVMFCSVTVLFTDAVGQSVTKKNGQAGGQGATFIQKRRFTYNYTPFQGHIFTILKPLLSRGNFSFVLLSGQRLGATIWLEVSL